MGKPEYDISEVKRLVAEGRFRVRSRPYHFVKNRYGDDPYAVVSEVFESIGRDDFRKTVELDKFPDMRADVYAPSYDGEAWYVKFFMEDDKIEVDVLSCNWYGYEH